MATTAVTVNDKTWTQVLVGSGFVYCEERIQYAFSATAPTIRGNLLPKFSQMTGVSTQTLWAKSVDEPTEYVYVSVA